MQVQPSDEDLCREAQNGKPAAFGILAERYQEKLIRYGRQFLPVRADIEDAVQDVLIKAYTNLKTFDPERRFSPWIYRIAHNTFINLGRTKKAIPFFSFDLDTFIPHRTRENNPEDQLEKKEIKQILDNGLAELDIKYKEPLILYYIEELDYKEIADILRLPVSTVGVRILRAKKILKEIIKSRL